MLFNHTVECRMWQDQDQNSNPNQRGKYAVDDAVERPQGRTPGNVAALSNRPELH